MPSTPNVAWVVGVGSSRGLGAALARRSARGGTSVVLTGRNEARLNTVAEQLRTSGSDAVALAGDISIPTEVDRLSSLVRRRGPLKAAVFNAGNLVRGTALEV